MANYRDIRYTGFPASSIASGTISNSRLNITEFDDDKIVNDLSTLGLRVHTQENLNASNTNSMYVDVFQESSGITSLTNVTNVDEYIASVYTTFTTPSLDIADYSSTYSATASEVSNVFNAIISKTKS